MTPKTIEEHIKKIALLFRYGTKEKIFIFVGFSLFGLAAWMPEVNDKFLKLPPELSQSVALGLYVLGGLCLVWVVYRFLFKLALSKPHDDRELPNAIRGLLAFTQEDGELFRKLGRDQELNSLNAFLKDEQIPIVVIMGESGAGKSSLLRAGLSHLIKGSNNAYVYWEALPYDSLAGLLSAVNRELNADYSGLNKLSELPQKAVIVLDQFEQLLPDNPEHKPIFELLSNVYTASPPYPVTWCIAFRREYSATWRDFELEYGLRPQMLSLKLFSVAQAQNVFVTLAEKAGLNLEQDLVDGFMKAVSHEQRVSPVEIGIGLQMLYELAQSKQKAQLSLQDYNFAGGSQGLFVSFLNNSLAQRFPEAAEREALYKVLLECIDLNRNQRIAEGKSMAQLAASSPHLPAEHLRYALDYFSSGQMRILEKLNADPLRYRLPHETMIPALRQLGGKVLSEVAEAELLLQTAYAAWQNSNKNSRYLLSGKELKKVLQFQRQLDLSNRKAFLKQSQQHRLKMFGSVFAFIVLMLSSLFYLSQSYLEEKVRSTLMAWGLPGDLMDYAGQLQSLSIDDNDVQHLDWLADFKKLTTLHLNLAGTSITNLSALQRLNQLTTLTIMLNDASLTDLSSLQGLKQLNTLNLVLDGTNIPDLDALQRPKQLTALYQIFNGADISDLSTLQGLKQLTTLNLNWIDPENINDISILQRFMQPAKLYLDFWNQKVTLDLSALQGLKQLTTLNLKLIGKEDKVSDLGALTSLKVKQITLDITYKKINSIKGIPNLTELKLGN